MKAGYIIPIEKTHREANPNLIIPALASNYKWKLTQKGKIITNKALTIPYLEVDKVMSSASSYFGDNYATLITDLIEKIELYTKMEPTEDLPKAFIEMSLKILEANLLQLSNANQLTSDMNLAVQREKLTRQFDI